MLSDGPKIVNTLPPPRITAKRIAPIIVITIVAGFAQLFLGNIVLPCHFVAGLEHRIGNFVDIFEAEGFFVPRLQHQVCLLRQICDGSARQFPDRIGRQDVLEDPAHSVSALGRVRLFARAWWRRRPAMQRRQTIRSDGEDSSDVSLCLYLSINVRPHCVMASVATWEHFRLFVLIGRQLHIKYTLYECLTPNPLDER